MSQARILCSLVHVVLENVRVNCLKVKPDEKHSVNELMISFNGKLDMKQYTKNKHYK